MPERTKKRWAIAFIVVLALSFASGWMDLQDRRAEKELVYGKGE